MAAELKHVSKYVSSKIISVCWEPASQIQLQRPRLFASGTWDDEVNKVSIWSSGELSDGGESVSEAGAADLMFPDGEPELICDIGHDGDVTDIKFLTGEALLVSSSRGSVSLYHLEDKALRCSCRWQGLHSYDSTVGRASCTAVAAQGTEFVSVGEDGRINVVDIGSQRQDAYWTVDFRDTCTLNDVCYIQQKTIAVVNSIGQFKVFDLRTPNVTTPTKIQILNGTRVSLHCMAQHPTQPHIVATGGEDGLLYMWDMRNEKLPVSLLEGHSTDVWDVQFHKSQPNHLFSCSNDGSLLHWDNSGNSSGMTAAMDLFGSAQMMDCRDWMKTSVRSLSVQNLLQDACVLSVNCLDATDTRLVCGTDSEQIIVSLNLPIY